MNKKGFTLVELLAVIAILAILVIIALPAVLKMFEQAKIDTFTNEINVILRSAEQRYFFDGGSEQVYSSESNPLEMFGSKQINYCISIDGTGKVTELKATKGKYKYSKEGVIHQAESVDVHKVDETELTIHCGLYNAECPTITNYIGEYDGSSHTITVSGGSGGTIEYSEDESTWSTAKPTRTNIGTTAVYVRVVGDTEHTDASCGNYSITINEPSTATITYNCNGGSGTAPAEATVNIGSNAELSNKPCGPKIASNMAYYQTGWSTSTSGSALASYTVSSNTTLYATWGQVFTYSGTYTFTKQSATQWYAILKTNGNLVFSTPTNVDFYAVGGGGGGGASGLHSSSPRSGSYGGAGGGGGAAARSVTGGYNASGTLVISIGPGGAGASTPSSNGSTGGTTTIKSGSTTLVSASGGGGGGSGYETTEFQAGSGGSGGSSTGGTLSGSTVAGKAGGSGASESQYWGTTYRGNGGTDGSYAFGSSSFGGVKYGASGGGGAFSWSNGNSACVAAGGTTGGGSGATTNGSGGYALPGGAATANTGSGGGGASGGGTPNGFGSGGAGGSGVVIIRNHR